MTATRLCLLSLAMTACLRAGYVVKYATGVGRNATLIAKGPDQSYWLAGSSQVSRVTFNPFRELFSTDVCGEIRAIASDDQGNLYGTGDTNSCSGASDLAPGTGQYRALVWKINADGTKAYQTLLGPGQGNGIAVETGSAYVTGQTSSDAFPATSNSAQSRRAGGTDAFVLKLSADGRALSYSTFLGGSSDDFGVAIGVLGGLAYVAGTTSSKDFPFTSSSVLGHALGGDADIFAAKISETGSILLFSGVYTGNKTDEATDIRVTADGLYILASTNSTDLRTTPGAFQGGRSRYPYTDYPDYTDMFVLHLSLDGNDLRFATYIGGPDDDKATALEVARDGTIWFAGTGNYCCFPNPNALEGDSAGWFDPIVGRLSADGTKLLFASYLPATYSQESAYDLVSSPDGDIVVVTSASITTPGATTTGYSVVFLAEVPGQQHHFPTASSIGTGDYLASPSVPGSLVRLDFGTFSGITAVVANTTPLPRKLGAVSVRVGGQLAPLWSVASGAAVVQVPSSVKPGSTTLEVLLDAPFYSPPATTIGVSEIAPAVITWPAASGYCVGVSATGLNTPITRAGAGDWLTVYFTGQGPADEAVPDGEPAPLDRVLRLKNPVETWINDTAAVFTFAGLTPGGIGIAQATFIVPKTAVGYNLSGERTLKIKIGGIESGTCNIWVWE